VARHHARLRSGSYRLARGVFRVVHGVSLLATIAVGFVTYVGVLRLFRLRGAEDLWELPRKVLRRLWPRPVR
jgi:hypothetical protein